MPRRRLPALLTALALSVPLAACGGEEAAGGEAAGAPYSDITTDLSVAPEVPASEDPPPAELVLDDVVVGDGAEAVDGTTAEVRYVGAFYETGEQFDSSWSGGPEQTFPVPLGAGQVIPGFEQAITGMQVGGRRVAVIPSELAYGEQGTGPIPGGATLTFVIDLVEVSG